MTVVIDANLLVVLVSGDPRGPAARQAFREWLQNGEALHVPALLPYEVASALTRLVASDALLSDGVASAWLEIEAIPLHQHLLEAGQARVVEVARQLRRQSAYDAAYIVLAEQLGCELWTLDGPLARNAASIGFPVHLIT